MHVLCLSLVPGNMWAMQSWTKILNDISEILFTTKWPHLGPPSNHNVNDDRHFDICRQFVEDETATILWKSQVRYSDVIMSAMASQITSVSIIRSAVCPGANQRKHQSSAPLAIVRGIHRWAVNSPHKRPVTRKIVSIWWCHYEIVSSMRKWRYICWWSGVGKHQIICIQMLVILMDRQCGV